MLLAARLAFGAVTKSKRVTKLAVTKMGGAAASLGLFLLAADASISCAASLLCFTDVRRDKLLAFLRVESEGCIIGSVVVMAMKARDRRALSFEITDRANSCSRGLVIVRCAAQRQRRSASSPAL